MMIVLGRFLREASFFCTWPPKGKKEMTLGDAVNNRQGSFLFSLGI